MAVSAIQKCDDNTKNASWLKSTAIGALTGYSLKYLIPVTSQEKDEFYNAAVDEIETKAQKSRLNEIHLLAPKARPEIKSKEAFTRMCNSSNLTLAELNAKINLSNSTLDLVHQVNNKGKEITKQGIESLTASVKNIRPTSAFVLIGVSIGLGTALVHNISNKIVEEKIKALNAQAETNVVDSFDKEL